MGSRATWLTALVALCLLAGAATVSGEQHSIARRAPRLEAGYRVAEVPPEQWVARLRWLASELRDGTDAERADFAYFSLVELYEAYETEAIGVAEPGESIPLWRKDYRWARETEAYASGLLALAESVTEGSRVTIVTSSPESVFFRIDGEPVSISGPLIRYPGALEARILHRYCEIRSCEWPAELSPRRPRTPALPDAASQDLATARQAPGIRADLAQGPPGPPMAPVSMSFTGRSGPVCLSDAGVRIEFPRGSSTAKTVWRCERLVGELLALSDGLAGRVRWGDVIEWRWLRLEPIAGRSADRVIFNRRGDSFVSQLPLLAFGQTLVEQTRRWLQARVDRRPTRLVILDPTEILAYAEAACRRTRELC